MANKELGDWNPMEEAHGNPIFNTYVEGPGSHLSTHQQPFNRGGGGRGRYSGDSDFRLYISNIPLDMTQEGLKNVLMAYALPKRVYICDKRKPGYSATWGTADFVTFGDAEASMRGCNEKPPYNLIVKFATKPGSKNNGRDYERRPNGPATPLASKVNHLLLQEVPPKSDVSRKEALQCRLLIENCTDTNGIHCPIIQETDKEGFFLLPSRGEFTGLNAKNMSINSVFANEADGWKMGINRKYYPPSPGNSEKPRAGASSSPNQPSNSSRDNSFTNATDQVMVRQCKLCLTKTSGVCGACKNASYCSQACATADFPRHVTECYVPVPAVLFSEAANWAVHSPGNQKPAPSTPPQNGGLSKNNLQLKNADSPSNDAGNDIGAAGDGHGVMGHGHGDGQNTFMGGDGNKDNRPLANGNRKPFFNESNPGDTKSMERKSSPGGKPTIDWQDTAGNMSSPTPNRQSAGHQISPFNKQVNNDRMTDDSSIKKKLRIKMESLEPGISEEVEVTERSNFGIFVTKTCHKSAIDTLHNGLYSNWPHMLPFDMTEDVCAAQFEKGVYRGKILLNKLPSNPKLRVKYVDFGNIQYLNPNELKALPETFVQLPAQALQLIVPEGSSDLYNSYKPGTILNVTAIKKVEGSWLVDINPKEVDDPQSLTLAHTVSPQRQSDAVAGSVSPLVTTASPAVTPTRTSVGEEQKRIGAVELATETSCASEELPVGVFTMVTITHVVGDQIFWGTMNSRKDEIAALEAKLNIHLEANPSPCQPNVQDLVAVFYEECWSRAKVLKLTDVAKLGLIDYGKVIVLPLDKINALPDELKLVPRHAVKCRIADAARGFLQVDKQISVQCSSAVQGSDACYLVVMKTLAEPCTQQEKKVSAVKVADVPTSVLPPATGITSLPVEQLPTGVYTEVTVTEVAGRSFWVNMTTNMGVACDMLAALNKYCNGNPTPCQPQVGDIVAACFDKDWYRAKVLTVLPKFRVVYVDYGNESEVAAGQVKVLPKELTLIPTQAIKITFSKSTSDKYYDLQVDSSVRVKPIAGAEKSADGSMIVQVEGDIPLQVKPETPPQVPVVSKGRWYPLKSAEMPSKDFVVLNIGLPGKTGYACLNKNISQLNSLMCKLHEALSKARDVCQPQVGDIVAAAFDNIWHRAKVLNVAASQVQVALVDYGNTCILTPDQICRLPEYFHEFPGQALKIMFMDGTSDVYFNLDESAEFEAKVQQKLPDGTVVIEARNLKLGTAEGQAAEPDVQAIEQSPAATVPVTTSAIKTESSVDAPQELGLPCRKIEQLSASPDNQVMVSYTANDQVWVNLVSKSGDLAQTMATLDHMKSSLQPCNPKVGDYVAVYVHALEIWHRGKVCSVSPDTVSVLLIDYGCVEDVTPDRVKTLPEELTKLPAQGIPIQFSAGSPEKYMNLAIDDVIHLQLLTTVLNGTSIVLGLEK